LDSQLPVQSVPITTKESLNPSHGKVYSIHYVMKLVSDLRQVGGLLQWLVILQYIDRNTTNVRKSGLLKDFC
jgi:hypothetical protein